MTLQAIQACYRLSSDADVAGMAAGLLAQFDILPKPRIRQVTVHPFVTPTGAATTAVLGLEASEVGGQPSTAIPSPATAPRSSQVCATCPEGINHHICPSDRRLERRP